MQFWRCKCGKCESFGTDAPYRCSGCDECGVTLASHPDNHKTPEPHDFSYIEKVRTDQGEMTVTRCRYCHRTRERIAAHERR